MQENMREQFNELQSKLRQSLTCHNDNNTLNLVSENDHVIICKQM